MAARARTTPALGHRVVLITCTSGQLGFDGAGRSGDQPGHDALQTRVTRAGELQESAAILGISRVVNLGYDDSGMKGWPENEAPNAFVNKDVDAVARTIAAIMDEEDAAVVVTYDESGFYGHPDHMKANEVTRAAVALSLQRRAPLLLGRARRDHHVARRGRDDARSRDAQLGDGRGDARAATSSSRRRSTSATTCGSSTTQWPLTGRRSTTRISLR